MIAEGPWRLVIGALLGLVGAAVGLHIGSESAAKYTKDLQRLNKVLSDQNRELESANATLLKQLSADSKESSKSA